ncbi:MAG: acylneuraminate cytidylyltransferase family protein [Rhodospirillaceae bacterium]|jgi:CMP-N-acetylneuraminic acid synthetase|nr:acylneuraminate cytidylyltransferase family protein [Rhodospirillaceae bacterium]MBT5081531.1 acylneuraminate cytidylyltransferase family protein [Rhodospirillaceae bacterium]MBT5526973.1 acylneuraminate cytidylyltransferase family protein [Rhodospirillaceae bacterium]MBT5881869.1 acylneuraminate cytidylyltransferase family protein [Rhodospirillaceae bacterium]MBT6587574.1 acylneuraminate cytidylyltransferase family protein [Rhodospirillaceae bacterium]
MYAGKRILAVVPARGGSKGIRLKNLRPVRGVPMVAQVGAIIRNVDLIDRAIVSTDHDEIARVAETAGISAPFRRPDDLSGDRIGDLEVLDHALRTAEALDHCKYDVVVMLQPTSPLRRAEHVRDTITKLLDEDWDAVWTVTPTDSKAHPLKQLTVDRVDGRMDYYDPTGGQIIARQQLTPVYHRNGIAYAIKRDCLLEQKTIKGERTGALILEGELISIDTEWDIKLTEFILEQTEKTLI